MLERKHDSHKGQNGRVLIVGGSDDYVGAPALAGLAALRAGADLVTIACPERVAFAINSLSPDLITSKLRGTVLSPSHYPKVMKLAENADCIVMGPGLGTSVKTKDTVKKFCDKINKPKVIDADALKALEKVPKNCVLTPHTKEFELLFKVKPTRQKIQELAKKDQIILLKEPIDLISDGIEVRENPTGNAGMTVGGTGDILAGITAGLIAQGMPLFDAATMAANINGRAGDMLYQKYGYSFIASDLLGLIPYVD